MTGDLRVATVSTVAETVLLELDRDAVRGILAGNPALVEQLGKSLRRRLEERERALADHEAQPPEPADIFQRIREIFSL
jgi:CRP-like cAMP-binding protein